MKRILDKDTFNDKVGIVINPDNIRNYSSERDDYTELALVAIQNKPKTIKFISPEYKDYDFLCKEAIKQDVSVFPLISNKSSNYKKMGVMALIKNPFLVAYISKDSGYYMFFWKLAVSLCYKVLQLIDEEKIELFPLIEASIKQEPRSILFVNSNISIYSKLCKLAYSQNKNSVIYMDINRIDKKIVFEALRKTPDCIKNLDSSKDYYLEALEMVLKINGTLIKFLNPEFINENQEVYFKLLSIAIESSPEVVNYPCVINEFRLYNRKLKESLKNSKEYCDNCDELLVDLDLEYETLTKDLIESEKKENNGLNKPTMEININKSDCPVKVKTRKSII